jgi:hypothetical protein
MLDIGLRIVEIQRRELTYACDACPERRQSGRHESVWEGEWASKNEVGYRVRGRLKTCEPLKVRQEMLGPLVGIIEEHEHFFPGLSPMPYPGVTLAARGAETLRVRA